MLIKITPIKPNPPKGGDGMLRVFASSEKPWKTYSGDTKIAGLPKNINRVCGGES